METEIWRPVHIEEISHLYEVSNFGKVRNVHTKRVLKGGVDEMGYHRVRFRVKDLNFNKLVKIHRLVAKVFVPEVDGYDCIDHIDRDKSNNKASNLRWVDHQINNCNRTNNSHHGAHLYENNRRKNHYWIIDFRGRGVPRHQKWYNKKHHTLDEVKVIRDRLAEELGLHQPLEN